ncbi:unnamed protein product, partial [Polarella glacialis]
LLETQRSGLMPSSGSRHIFEPKEQVLVLSEETGGWWPASIVGQDKDDTATVRIGWQQVWKDKEGKEIPWYVSVEPWRICRRPGEEKA